jgi:hypothetical protein
MSLSPPTPKTAKQRRNIARAILSDSESSIQSSDSRKKTPDAYYSQIVNHTRKMRTPPTNRQLRTMKSRASVMATAASSPDMDDLFPTDDRYVDPDPDSPYSSPITKAREEKRRARERKRAFRRNIHIMQSAGEPVARAHSRSRFPVPLPTPFKKPAAKLAENYESHLRFLRDSEPRIHNEIRMMESLGTSDATRSNKAAASKRKEIGRLHSKLHFIDDKTRKIKKEHGILNNRDMAGEINSFLE